MRGDPRRPDDPADGPADPATRVCLTCGACCAAFRVAFYWAEADDNGLPERLIERLDPWRACMVGTNARAPHCGALEGTVGVAVRCSVHPQRPSPCRAVMPGDDQCVRARARHGLGPVGGPEVPAPAAPGAESGRPAA